MLNTLVLLRYNNYYARRLKKEATLQAYLQHQVLQFSNVNFNPNDGVNATHVINQPTDMSNYMLVLDEANNIISRWFILEAKRNLNGQYTIQLRRDLWADYTTDIMNATTFVEKGIAANSDTAIFNDEQVTFNQIKVSESLLKDNTGCRWLVGYYARKNSEGVVTTIKGTGVDAGDQIVNLRVAGISNWEYYKYTTTEFVGVPSKIIYNGKVRNSSTNLYGDLEIINYYPDSSDTYRTDLPYSATSNNPLWWVTGDSVDKLPNECKKRTDELHTRSKTVIDWHTATDTTAFLNLKGINILDTTNNKLYNVSLSSQTKTSTATVAFNSSLEQMISTCMSASGATYLSQNGTPWTIDVYGTSYTITLIELENKSVNYEIAASRYFTTDAPYDIFAIPYSDTFIFTGNGSKVVCSKDIAMAVANDIATLIPSNTVYDIQLLPYCPFDTSEFIPAQYSTNDTKEYSWITSGETKVGVIFNVSKSQRTFNITSSVKVTNTKMDNATKFVRLVSPNYNGQFEFTPAKNDGIDYYNVDITYKPFSPYIHINPNFKRLYGNDYNDARGLICGGDFSIPVVNDQWKTYQINNKNYQSIFDRQIENMEVKNNIARIQEPFQIAAGTLAGGAAGGLVGGIPGAAIGAGASLAAGIADIGFNEQLRQEALDYTKDQFGMQMGNIKALPNSLVKVSSFNYNNKGFPVVEYYDCNEDEKIAFAKKIMYNGMTINRIDTFNTYVGTWSYSTVSITKPYLKGRLIRFNTEVDGDTHLWNAIAEEMYKGVYYELTE